MTDWGEIKRLRETIAQRERRAWVVWGVEMLICVAIGAWIGVIFANAF